MQGSNQGILHCRQILYHCHYCCFTPEPLGKRRELSIALWSEIVRTESEGFTREISRRSLPDKLTAPCCRPWVTTCFLGRRATHWHFSPGAPARSAPVTPGPGFPPASSRPRLPVNTRGCRQGRRDWRSPARPPLRRLPSCQLPVRCELDFGATAGEWGFCSITKTSAWMAGLPAPSPARQAERNRLVNVCDLSLETALFLNDLVEAMWRPRHDPAQASHPREYSSVL